MLVADVTSPLQILFICSGPVLNWGRSGRTSLKYYLGHMATLLLQTVYPGFLVLLPLLTLLKIWSRPWHLPPCWPVGWFSSLVETPQSPCTLSLGCWGASQLEIWKTHVYTKKLAEIVESHLGSLSELYTLLRLLLWAGTLISAIVIIFLFSTHLPIIFTNLINLFIYYLFACLFKTLFCLLF